MGELDDTIDAVAAESHFSGLISVDAGDRPAVRRAVGSADRRFEVPFRTATRAAIASGTKGFTASMVMSVVESGELALDTPVRSMLGDDLPDIDDAVTVEQLLSHWSGIGDYLDESQLGAIDDHVLPVPVHQLTTADDYLAVLAGHPQSEPPGSRFVYNNGAFVVLAIVAERAAGTAHDELLAERVCRPAGLTSTSFVRSDCLPGDVATGYLDAHSLRTNALHLPLLGCGDGGLFSTLDDLTRFWKALFDGDIVSPGSVTAMTTPRFESDRRHGSYGLGLWLDHLSSTVSLEGYDAGVSFRSLHDPVAGTTLTVISNWSDGAWPMLRALQPIVGMA